MTPPPVVVVAPAESRRVALLNAALAQQQRPPTHHITYTALLGGHADLRTLVAPGAVVRLESPGKDAATERALLLVGAALPAGGYAHTDAATLATVVQDKGRICWPHQWYRGFCYALEQIRRALAECPPHQLHNHPHDIAMMFDKPRCHELLAGAGLPVPPTLGPVGSYAELLERMQRARMSQVFVKLAHGSSASGVVALRVGSRGQIATTTAEVAQEGGETRLYNSRRIRTYRDTATIAALIDELCRHRVHTEQWLPKAGMNGKTFDLRVVVLDGRARHTVVRQSATPLTNLHLLNGRGDLAAVQARMGAAWDAARATCEAAMRCFPQSRYAGIDLLISADFRRHAILEMNAFGDLLPGITDAGQDTYAAAIAGRQAS